MIGAMPRFAANLTMLFREVPTQARFAAARDAGFDGVEMLFPYAHSLPELQTALKDSGLPMVLINTPEPGWDDGARGRAAIPGAEAQFRDEFRTACAWAHHLGAGMIHVMAGLATGDAAWRTYIDNLRWAAAEAPDRMLTIEPVNPTDMPGYFLNDFDLAARVLDAVGAANLHLQFDAYHAHRITGDVMGTWARHRHRVVHVQVAGAEGRHEPVRGAIDYPAFFERLDAEGYTGVVSAEYLPAGDTQDGLNWMGQAQSGDK